jgi:hypothetical protein
VAVDADPDVLDEHTVKRSGRTCWFDSVLVH